jgi:hypothetical protein
MRHQLTSTQELEEPANLAAQRRESRIERWGWCVWGATVVAALLGGLGPGLLSARTSTSPDGRLTVRYDAILRHDAPSRLVVDCESASGNMAPTGIALPREFAHRNIMEAIVPQPVDEQLLPEEVLYRFRTEDARGPLRVQYVYRTATLGWQQLEVRVEGGPRVEIAQFVCP